MDRRGDIVRGRALRGGDRVPAVAAVPPRIDGALPVARRVAQARRARDREAAAAAAADPGRAVPVQPDERAARVVADPHVQDVRGVHGTLPVQGDHSHERRKRHAQLCRVPRRAPGREPRGRCRAGPREAVDRRGDRSVHRDLCVPGVCGAARGGRRAGGRGAAAARAGRGGGRRVPGRRGL